MRVGLNPTPTRDLRLGFEFPFLNLGLELELNLIFKQVQKFELTPTPLSYAVASRLLQRSSCLELIQNRKGVERTASDQKRKIDRAQGRRTQRSSAL